MLRQRRRREPFFVDVESGEVKLGHMTKRGLLFSAACVGIVCVIWCVSLVLFEEDGGVTQQDKCCHGALRAAYAFVGDPSEDAFYSQPEPCLCRQSMDTRFTTKFHQRLQRSHAQSKCVIALEFGIPYCVGSFAVSESDHRIIADPVVHSVGSSFYDVTEEYTSFTDENKPKRVSVSTRRPHSAVVSYSADSGQHVQHQQVFGQECHCLIFLHESCSNATRK